MKKCLVAIATILGLLIVIGLSIWLGFPATPNFDRDYICLVGYIIGVGLVGIGIANYIGDVL